MAIGVFDSGVGGLSVHHRLVERFPTADLIYLADQANAQGDLKDATQKLSDAMSKAGDKSDSTNTDLLIGKSYAPFGSLGQYTQEPKIYKCTLDKSTVNIAGATLPRVRTISMNSYMNGDGVWNDPNFVTFKKLEEIPNPSDAWVFIEEREDSINDGYFAVKMADRYTILDNPANYHDNGCYLTFADGHVEKRVWSEATTTPPLIPGVHLWNLPINTSAGDQDLKWLTERTTIGK